MAQQQSMYYCNNESDVEMNDYPTVHPILTQSIQESFQPPFVRIYRLQNILAYHRSLQGLSSRLNICTEQYASSSSVLNTMTTLKSPNLLNEHSDIVSNQHMFTLEQEGININDVDWESMPSDDNENDGISAHTNRSNQIQSDENRDHFDYYSSSPYNNSSSRSDNVPKTE
ncbi:unnamed protein product [Rotaria sp. Silwood2]|nr:unnamed protein product [Rotaria sp. Silwood2]